MRKFACEQITREEEKELCFVMHNGKTEEERNHVRLNLYTVMKKKFLVSVAKNSKIFMAKKLTWRVKI